MHKPFPVNLDDEVKPCRKAVIKIRIGSFEFKIDALHWSYKMLAYTMLIPYLYFAWWLFSPWSSAWSSGSNEIPLASDRDLEK
jgi:hypothetical protein